MKPESKYLSATRRRAATIKTMIALAARHIPSEITTSAIAERMNVTQGALFRHFTSKEAMWHAAMEWIVEQLLARIDRAAQRAPSPLRALEAAFMAHLDFVARHPGVPRMLFGELQRAEPTAAKQMVRNLLTQYAQRLHALLEQGKAQGEVAAEIDLNAAATLFIGLIQGLIMQSLVAGKISRLHDAGPGVFALFARAVQKAP